MEKEKSVPEKGGAIIIEQAGMRMTIDYRQGVGDEGLTFDITVAGSQDQGKRILRFDCFHKKPHYHIGPSGRHPVHDMRDEGIEDPVRWTLNTLKTRLPALVTDAGYEKIAESIDQKAIAESLSRVERDILAKI